MLEQQCPAKVLRRKTKTNEVKCGLVSCSALNIHVVWQWRWQAKSNGLSLSLSLALFTPRMLFLTPPPWISRTQTACLATPYNPSPNAIWGSCGCTLAGNQQTSGFPVLSVRTYSREASGPSHCPSVWSIDYRTTIALPRDCSERLPFWWTSSFF